MPCTYGTARVDLDDDDLGPRRDRAVPEVRGTEVEVPVGVDRAGLDHHDLGRVDEPAVVVGDLAEVARDVVLQPGVALLAVVAAEVPVEEVEVLAVGIGLDAPLAVARSGSRGCSRRGARRPARPAPVSNASGCAEHRAVVEPVARADERCRSFRRDASGRLRGGAHSSAQRSCPTLRQWGRAEAQGSGGAARQKFWERWVHDEHRQAHDDAGQRERGARRLAGAAAHVADVVQDRLDGEGNGARRADRRSGRRGEPPSRPDDHLPARPRPAHQPRCRRPQHARCRAGPHDLGDRPRPRRHGRARLSSRSSRSPSTRSTSRP